MGPRFSRIKGANLNQGPGLDQGTMVRAGRGPGVKRLGPSSAPAASSGPELAGELGLTQIERMPDP